MVYARRVIRSVLALTALAACGSGNPPDLHGLSDQVAAVGQELVIELDGTDPDGDALEYGVRADISLDDNATMTKTPGGAGLFRWTPTSSDVGVHTLDFTVSDGDNDTTVSISVDVRATSGGQPVFRQPLGTGRVVDLTATPCVTVDVLVEDSDSTDVTIAEEAPLSPARCSRKPTARPRAGAGARRPRRLPRVIAGRSRCRPTTVRTRSR